MWSNLSSRTRTPIRAYSSAIGASTRGPTRRVFLTFPRLSAHVTEIVLVYAVINGTTIALFALVSFVSASFLPPKLLFTLNVFSGTYIYHYGNTSTIKQRQYIVRTVVMDS